MTRSPVLMILNYLFKEKKMKIEIPDTYLEDLEYIKKVRGYENIDETVNYIVWLYMKDVRGYIQDKKKIKRN